MNRPDLRELLRPRVERGAALLDSVEPRWWERVTEALDVSDCDRCPLGQVFGDYDDALDELHGRESSIVGAWAWAAAHGFEHSVDPKDITAEYATLDALWLEVIAERRAS